MSGGQPKRGRPTLPPGERKSERIELRTTAERRAKAERLAASAGMSLNAWLEDRIDRARQARPASPGA